MIKPPDWQDAENILFDHVQQAIHIMEMEHPDIVLSFFAFYAEPIRGCFEFHFDTPQSAIQGAMRREQEIVKRREKMLQREEMWQSAHYYIDIPHYSCVQL